MNSKFNGDDYLVQILSMDLEELSEFFYEEQQRHQRENEAKMAEALQNMSFAKQAIMELESERLVTGIPFSQLFSLVFGLSFTFVVLTSVLQVQMPPQSFAILCICFVTSALQYSGAMAKWQNYENLSSQIRNLRHNQEECAKQIKNLTAQGVRVAVN